MLMRIDRPGITIMPVTSITSAFSSRGPYRRQLSSLLDERQRAHDHRSRIKAKHNTTFERVRLRVSGRAMTDLL